MKNLLIANSTGHLGGAEKILTAFLAGLDRKAFALFAVTPSVGKFSDILKGRGIDPEVVGGLYEKGFATRDGSFFRRPLSTIKGIWGLFEFSRGVSRYIRRRNIDCVVSCGVKASIAAGIAGRQNKKPSVWLIQDILPDNLYRKAFFLCGRLFSDKIIVISKAIEKTFPHYLEDKTEMIYPFLKQDELSSARAKDSLRRELNIKDDEVVLGAFGKLAPAKGLDIFLKVSARLKKSCPNIKILIAGDSKLEVIDPGYINELKELAGSLGLEGDCIFLGWRDDIYKVLATIDILVHTPRRPEGFGRILIEAMAASKAVVAFDQGAVREIIDDRISGMLVEPFDEADLQVKLEWLVRDRKKIDILGEAARRKAEKYFSEASYNNEFGQALEDYL